MGSGFWLSAISVSAFDRAFVHGSSAFGLVYKEMDILTCMLCLASSVRRWEFSGANSASGFDVS